MTLLSKKRIEGLIKKELGITISLKPVEGKVFDNVADYDAALPNIFAGIKSPRISDNYDGGLYQCVGRHFILLFEKRE